MTDQAHALISLPSALFKRLRSLTEGNLHSECYEHAARALGHTELEDQFRRIRFIHDRQGELSYDLSRQRYRLYEEMLQFAKSNLSSDQYQKLYMCF